MSFKLGKDPTCHLNWERTPPVFKLGDDPPVFKLGEDPPVPFACVGIYILRNVFYEAYYTCLLPHMRNVYITCLLFSFKHVVYFLECVRDLVYFYCFQVGSFGVDSVFQPCTCMTLYPVGRKP